MFRRGDPRWNRTIQNIADNFEHANESTQEHLYSFTHAYINPCLSSITFCLNTCTQPCFPSRDDRRRHRARRVRGRPEQSFDFYDDWEEDENDGLLDGWGNDYSDPFYGRNSNLNYGTTVSQPGRQRGMSYGTRNRDPRFNAGRRKSAVQPHDGGPDPTIIPSSSYFGFLGRLPFKIGGKVLRYKPSAADLVEHPGQGRRSLEEEEPLVEDSEEEAEQGKGSEGKGHKRQRSHTDASGHTTDSLSSRGDIFPSEDELDDAVPLDDEFTMALERRTTSQWHDETSSGRTRSGSKSARPAGSRVSTRTVSSRNTQDSGRKSHEDAQLRRSASAAIEEVPTMADLKQEEERVRREEEQEVERKRHDAQQLALKKGLTADQHLNVQSGAYSSRTVSPSPSPHVRSQKQMSAVPVVSPLVRTPSPNEHNSLDAVPFPTFEEPQTAPDSGGFHVDESDYSSVAPTPNRSLSLKDEPREVQQLQQSQSSDESFVPARLPYFSSQPD